MKKEDLIGLDITEAREKLGYWWVLIWQFVNPVVSSFYRFRRAGYGTIELITESNKVVKVEGNYFNFYETL